MVCEAHDTDASMILEIQEQVTAVNARLVMVARFRMKIRLVIFFLYNYALRKLKLLKVFLNFAAREESQSFFLLMLVNEFGYVEYF